MTGNNSDDDVSQKTTSTYGMGETPEQSSDDQPQFEIDTYGDEAQIWIRSDGTVHVGDSELSWRLTPRQAQEWAKVLWQVGNEAEEVWRS